jgi:hypothetical protein
MKTEPILLELEAVKDRLVADAGDNTRRFLDQMEAWLMEHPHPGPVVNSAEELQSRLLAREATEPPPTQGRPYLVHDPVIAEVHRIRESLHYELQAGTLILKDEPTSKQP